MTKFKFNTETLQESLANIEVAKMEGSKDTNNDFVAIKPSVQKINGKEGQYIKFSACNQGMQVDSFASCESESGKLEEANTCFVPRRFIDACKCIIEETITLVFEETSVSLLDAHGNKVPFPVLNPENHILTVPDVAECPDNHPLSKSVSFYVGLQTETLSDGLSTFGAIAGVKKLGEYTLDGIGCSIDPEAESLILMSSNGHVFRKGSVNYLKFNNYMDEDINFIIPQDVSAFIRVADRYEDSSVSIKVIGALLVVMINTTIAYFRLKQESYVPASTFDSILGGETMASCKVDSNEFLTKLKLMEVSASSDELVGNLLGVELEIKGNSMCLKNPKSPKTKISVKAEDCSGEETIFINGTELGKLVPKEETLKFDICSVGKGGKALKVNGYHVMLPLSNN